MFTMAIGLRGQARHMERVPAKAVRLAALLGTLILVSVAVNALIVVADSIARTRPLAAASCSASMQMADRSACGEVPALHASL
jgi:hypothetical protein